MEAQREENPRGVRASSKAGVGVPQIIDIRSDTAGIELKQQIQAGLKSEGEKTLPTLLLYNEQGLRLFERITYLDQYYLTGEEINVLEQYADRMVERIPSGGMLVELGSGNLRKTKILLDGFERAKKHVSYYALDLMEAELHRTLAAVPAGTFQYVQCFGLWGTYDDGLVWFGRAENAGKSKAILSLGSSIGNFTREEAASFIQQFGSILNPHDMLLIGVDACQDPKKVYPAYNDHDGVTHRFTLNGLQHANELLAYTAFRPEDWEAVGEYDQDGERHRAFVSPNKDVHVEGIMVRKGEKVRIEESYKYSPGQAKRLWSEAGVIESASWANEVGSYALHMLQRPDIMFPTKPENYAARPVPSLEEWALLWALWDKVTRQMIPDEELTNKPIRLRNACIFYLGHIPTFFDMKLVEATGLPPSEPKYFHQIFERGIDPDVEDPTKCHAHSEIPDAWPDLEVILRFQNNVRNRVRDLYKYGQAYNDAWTGRALWLGFEHEIMHLETLLYMVIQSEKTLPPAGTIKPDFQQLAAQAHQQAVPNQWFDISEKTITIGLEDADNGDGPQRHFGWDAEKPSTTVKVPAFQAQARPISIGEYAHYLFDTKNDTLPSSWMLINTSNGVNGVNGVNGHQNGDAGLHDFVKGKAVRTVYGPVPLEWALDWPVAASYEELNACAKYMGGRIPTMEEARSIYEHAAVLKRREATNALGRTIPAVNGHLVNEGVEESPPSNDFLKRSSSTAAVQNPRELYEDLSDANVGFKHWHPMPVTQNGNKLSGQGEIGGLWEWTSSVLEKRKGFAPMKLYPAYSADFYDEKHNIVLGGSWATHPRLAGRKTFVNWYQRNYPYVWAGARLVRDV